jgi:hypothetical protein
MSGVIVILSVLRLTFNHLHNSYKYSTSGGGGGGGGVIPELLLWFLQSFVFNVIKTKNVSSFRETLHMNPKPECNLTPNIKERNLSKIWSLNVTAICLLH